MDHQSANQPGKEVFTEEFRVNSFDLSPMKKASFQSLCYYYQEISSRHADALGVGFRELSKNDISWVLSRFLVRIRKYPTWDEMVTLRTYTEGVDRLLYYRRAEMLDSSGEVMGEFIGAYLLINLKTRKLHRVREVREFERFMGPVSEKLEKLPDPGNERQSTWYSPVLYTDLDLNDHVNNVRYIERVMNSFSPEFHHTHTLVEMEMNFLSESRYGDELLVSNAGLDEENSYMTGLSRKETGEEVFRARSKWK